MVVHPLSLLIMSYMPEGYKQMGRLAGLSIFLVTFVSIIAICIRERHNDDYFLKGKRKDYQTEREDSILEVENLTLTIEKHKVLSDITMDIKKNEIIGLLGANGSGKTTFIKVLLG